jgi:Transposase and inactivated derivatives
MSRKGIADSLEKVKIVEKILTGETGVNEASRLAGVNKSTIQQWRDLYLSEGPTALLNQKSNRVYSKDLKLKVVIEYLSGQSSLQKLVKKYHLRSHTQICSWCKEYNTHGEIKSYGSGGGSYMRKARSTTYEERLIIVKDCLANDKNYGTMALKYQCSYQQVRNWVKQYEGMGSAGLEDRRGRRAGSMPSRTPEEALRDKIAELDRKNKDLQMENDLLKKVKELEMKDRYL